MAPAAADPVGSIVSVSGEQGAVVVLRSGESITATSNLALEPNDRVIVRADGAVDLEAEGCGVSLAAPAMAVINEQFCETQPARIQSAETQQEPVAGTERSSGLSGTAEVAGAAGAGALAIAAAAAGGSDGAGSTAAATGVFDAATGASGDVVGNGSGDSGPVTGNVNVAFDAGSGLDTGLFGFFESTSS